MAFPLGWRSKRSFTANVSIESAMLAHEKTQSIKESVHENLRVHTAYAMAYKIRTKIFIASTHTPLYITLDSLYINLAEIWIVCYYFDLLSDLCKTFRKKQTSCLRMNSELNENVVSIAKLFVSREFCGENEQIIVKLYKKTQKSSTATLIGYVDAYKTKYTFVHQYSICEPRSAKVFFKILAKRYIFDKYMIESS